MKRSEINSKIRNAIDFFDQMKFSLPPWAYWDMETWRGNAPDCLEIFNNKLGWDITDFGSNRFSECGLILFTIRNGNPGFDKKPYAEKIMIVDENQLTPLHFHGSKMEDIINRGGGNLVLELYNSNSDASLSKLPVKVKVDGILKEVSPGGRLILTPGESITFEQRIYHLFYGEPKKGRVLVGEVSSVNDDTSDNHFHLQEGRFPKIEEDVEPEYLLASDYASIY